MKNWQASKNFAKLDLKQSLLFARHLQHS